MTKKTKPTRSPEEQERRRILEQAFARKRRQIEDSIIARELALQEAESKEAQKSAAGS